MNTVALTYVETRLSKVRRTRSRVIIGVCSVIFAVGAAYLTHVTF